MLIVRNDPVGVEADLAAGRLCCPGCGEVLGPWWFARWRVLRDGRRFRPRRGRCKGCRSTHVLLPDVCLLRRRDSVEVIGVVLSEHSEEARVKLAERLGVPWETVRDWWRRFGRWAEAIRAHFTRWLLALTPGTAAPGGVGSRRGDALEAIGSAARAASLRLGPRSAWSWVSVLTAGRLLSNTSVPWPTPD